MRSFKVMNITVLLMVAFLLLSACGNTASDQVGQRQEEKIITDTAFKLDTVVTISIYDWEDENTIERAFYEIDRLESILSVNKEGSDLYRLYQNAGIQPVQLSDEAIDVLKATKEYSIRSEGRFDVTAGPLISLWNIHEGQGHYPTDAERQKAIKSIDYNKLLLADDNMAFLPEPGMKVDLGAIAKGYIADRIKDLLLEEGVEHAIINLGGNVLTIGQKTDSTPFAIGIQDPKLETGNIVLAVSINDESLVSSGVYERDFEYNGTRFHHILDPFTGFPADNDLAGVTILSKSSMQGDALSTVCLLDGLEKGMALIESLDGVEAVFISKDGTITMTSGMEARVISQ